MNWTTANNLHAQVHRLWERGDLLRVMAGEEARFPLRLKLNVPSSAELLEHFALVSDWTADLMTLPQVRHFLARVQTHRVLGTRRVPESVWVADVDNAITLIGKQREAMRFQKALALTRKKHSALLPWLMKFPLQAIEFSEDWNRLLEVADWMVAHPRPGIYLRQIDISRYPQQIH